MESLIVSIIIATKNEERNIKNCIESLLKQTYKNIEIIVVDNNSSDNTRTIAKKITKKVYNLPEYILLERVRNFRGAQINYGVKNATGEIIFFPDADMTFSDKLIEDAVNKLKSYHALYIPEIICGNGLFGKIREFERRFYNQTSIDAIRILSKQLFLSAGGFDEKNIAFSIDDWDFTKTLKKMNVKFGITNYPLYHHEEWLTLKTYLNKKRKYFTAFDSYIKKWGKNDLDIKEQFGLRHRYFKIFFENGHWKEAIRHPLLTMGVYFLKLLVGVVFLSYKLRM